MSMSATIIITSFKIQSSSCSKAVLVYTYFTTKKEKLSHDEGHSHVYNVTIWLILYANKRLVYKDVNSGQTWNIINIMIL